LARVHGKDLSSLTVDAVNMLADTVSLGFKASAETHDTTTLGDDWREAIAGLKGGDEFDHVLFYDNTNTTGSWAKYTGMLGGAAVTLAFGDGTRSVSLSVLVTGLSLPIAVGDMMMITATLKATGTISFT
jgi:hypothetical protein